MTLGKLFDKRYHSFQDKNQYFFKIFKYEERALNKPQAASPLRFCDEHIWTFRLRADGKSEEVVSQLCLHCNSCVPFRPITKSFCNPVLSCKNNANTQVKVGMNLLELVGIL